jgi:hypothetical protein
MPFVRRGGRIGARRREKGPLVSNDMNRIFARSGALLCMAALFLLPWCTRAQSSVPPLISPAQVGATVEDVSVETYGVVKPQTVRRYLSIHRGDRLDQAAVDRDFANLAKLGAYRTRLHIRSGRTAGSVRLRWIVMSKWLKPTTHPYYGDTPLSAPIQGVGFILTGPSMDQHGTNFSAYTQLSRRANLARLLFTSPLNVNPDNGQTSSLVVDEFGGRGDFRASEPKAINVYSWTTGQEALLLSQGTNGTQVEGGFRLSRSTDELSSGIVAPSLYNTSMAPARTTGLVAGVTHACTTSAYRWYPPFCNAQYRFQVTDGIGGFGSTSRYRSISGDVARYFPVGDSTLALHATAARTAGVLPDSFLVCATVRGYPKSFCGTDAQGMTAEFRIDDAQTHPLEFVLFTETASSRVRAGDQPQALPYFTWHPDSGVGVMYHLVRIDLAYGKAGGRLTFELKGQTF